MKNLKASEIRQKYLDFFVEKGHMVEPSAPLVPIDDDSLLWINSGVATLKNISMVEKHLRNQELLTHKRLFVRMILKMLVSQQDTILSLKC